MIFIKAMQSFWRCGFFVSIDRTTSGFDSFTWHFYLTAYRSFELFRTYFLDCKWQWHMIKGVSRTIKMSQFFQFKILAFQKGGKEWFIFYWGVRKLAAWIFNFFIFYCRVSSYMCKYQEHLDSPFHDPLNPNAFNNFKQACSVCINTEEQREHAWFFSTHLK